MGLLDIPAPLFAWIDNDILGLLPPALRLVAWALIASALTLTLYVLISPQRRIARAKKEVKRTRRELNAYDGEFSGAGPLIRAQLGASLRHVGLVLPATLLGALPLVCLLTWLNTAYGYSYPPAGAQPAITTDPTRLPARWRPAGKPDGNARPVVRIGGVYDSTAISIQLSQPVPAVYKHQWWNFIIGNPVGYLPPDAPIDNVHIALPARTYLAIGPAWARSWLAIFIPVFFVTSLSIHRFSGIA